MTNITPNKAIKDLADVVRKEGGVSIKFGRTNGRDCLHLKSRDKATYGTLSSFTIYEPWEWDEHPWNWIARKEHKAASQELQEAVSNKDAQ